MKQFELTLDEKDISGQRLPLKLASLRAALVAKSQVKDKFCILHIMAGVLQDPGCHKRGTVRFLPIKQEYHLSPGGPDQSSTGPPCSSGACSWVNLNNIVRKHLPGGQAEVERIHGT